MESDQFSFEISLSVLNHLGRNLYRSFATVLGEAISNSWDADAQNVWIFIDKENDSFVIKDDGVGMSKDDFQTKFLKIGYSKRKEGQSNSGKGRPFIGRKGIGKLALLSCANKIHVISKIKNEDYIGGVIDNSDLDEAINEDLVAQKYLLENVNNDLLKKYQNAHEQGTIIYFEGVKDGIKSSLEFLKKIIALYFRFSLLDESFKIYLDDKEITLDCLDELFNKTEFLWQFNDYSDPYIQNLDQKFTPERNEKKQLDMGEDIRGFIASVEKPSDLKINSTGEKLSIDLFVNGRLRERDILKHIPTARVAESYLYGQIHFDGLDDSGADRFTTSRENIVEDDPKFKEFLEDFRKKILEIVADWDKWRIKHKKDGDSENDIMTRKERKSRELFNAVSEEYSLPEGSANKKIVFDWVDQLGDDAQYNFGSYAECFISENLLRKYIEDKKIPLSDEAKTEADKWIKSEDDNKNKGNISVGIRKNANILNYLSLDYLAALFDKKDPLKEACLLRDSYEYKPIRDALAHTSLLTTEAKAKLTSIYENIKGRIIKLLSQ